MHREFTDANDADVMHINCRKHTGGIQSSVGSTQFLHNYTDVTNSNPDDIIHYVTDYVTKKKLPHGSTYWLQ
jgi:hypothetical protein